MNPRRCQNNYRFRAKETAPASSRCKGCFLSARFTMKSAVAPRFYFLFSSPQAPSLLIMTTSSAVASNRTSFRPLCGIPYHDRSDSSTSAPSLPPSIQGATKFGLPALSAPCADVQAAPPLPSFRRVWLARSQAPARGSLYVCANIPRRFPPVPCWRPLSPVPRHADIDSDDSAARSSPPIPLHNDKCFSFIST